ncbi:sel1 repeat family protein [Alphaproteobacteria bacterium]|nr:sel1 repeat family protein [Alphaproteobacteria bacterium]
MVAQFSKITYLSGFIALLMLVFLGQVYAASEEEGHNLYRAGLYNEGLAVWEKAAKNGDAGAAFRAGVEYFDAKIVKRDIKKAIAYFELSAKGNDPRGLTDLAAIYDYGNGVNVNRKKAAQLYLRAANLGFPDAMFNIAAMLSLGEGIKKDKIEAYKFYKMANAQGFAAFAEAALAELEKDMSAEDIAEANRRVSAFKPTN